MNKTTQKKKRLRSKADRLWFQLLLKEKCEVCGRKAVQVHHAFPKGLFGHLRYDLDNGISLCVGCHFALHHKADPRIMAGIIKARGKKWYDKLEKRANSRTHYQTTITYYEQEIKELQEKMPDMR